MIEQTNNKTIAKNTIFLYFRMLFTMFVSLYTSRVILEKLGINDFGIYQTVGGVVAMLSFINGALSTGSSRFLTFELGIGNFDNLKRTFSSVLSAHILLALLIVIVAETIGLWFVYNKLVIPQDRMNAAVWVYHISIVTSLVTITQVPYNSSIIAHEKMSVYAYMSILEVLLKLGICYMLSICGFDQLKVYSTLLCIVTVSIALFYRFYCTKMFPETHYKPIWDKQIMKGVLQYSGWNLFANTAIALTTQGTTILINLFFSPAVVTARAIANQVNMAANQFITNFRTAVNPQIVKKFAAGDMEGSKSLLLSSTKYSYYLMLLLALPIYLIAEELLNIWLVDVPEYTVPFLQLTIITSLFQVFDTSFYTALYAKGQIKQNALVSPTFLFLLFPIVYLMFKMDYSPLCLAWGLLMVYAILGLIVKPILIIKIVDYSWRDIVNVFSTCLKVTMASVLFPVLVYIYREELFSNVWYQTTVLVGVSFFCVAISVWLIGLDRETKDKLLDFIKCKLKR